MRLWSEAIPGVIPDPRSGARLGAALCVSQAVPLLLSAQNRGEEPRQGRGGPRPACSWESVGVFPTVLCLPVCDSKHCLDPRQIGSN